MVILRLFFDNFVPKWDSNGSQTGPKQEPDRKECNNNWKVVESQESTASGKLQ